VLEAGMDFGPFGERRGWADPRGPINIPPTTTRGYTGHEMLDGLDVVHMNGRVFDNRIGRFLQVDPFVQEPGNAQNHNRYTYLWNNPLNATDPSGYIGVKERQWAAVVVTIVAAAYCGPCGASVYGAAATGAVVGGIATGSWKGALYGGLSAAAFYGIGSGFAQVAGNNVSQGPMANMFMRTGLTPAQFASKVIAHGATGGVMSAIQGGSFGHGFASAAVTQGAAGRIDTIGNTAGRVAVAALVGGSVSALTGGKFANGAVTAAFSRAFNDEAEGRASTSPEERQANDLAVDHAGGLSAELGRKVADEAGTWTGTPYSLVGASSEKGIGGDFSGSTWQIFRVAGFDYNYASAGSFVSEANAGLGSFRRIYYARAGDVVAFSGHVAIYEPSANTARGDDMWTVFRPNGPAYKSQAIRYWGRPVIGYYRYVQQRVSGAE